MNGATQQKSQLTLVVAFVALERAVELWPLLQDPAVLEVKLKGLRRGLHGPMISAAIQLLDKRVAVVLPIEVGLRFSRVTMTRTRFCVLPHFTPRTATAVIQRRIYPLPPQGPREVVSQRVAPPLYRILRRGQKRRGQRVLPNF